MKRRMVDVFGDTADINTPTLTPSNSMEMCKKQELSQKETQNAKQESDELSSSSDDAYGKAVEPPTPSPTKNITPQINIKHESSENV